MPIRDYSGTAKATALTGAITASATVINVADATGWPTGAVGPFVITLDAGVTTEEKVLVSGRTGNSLTVQTRGFDGTTASDHGNAASVQHTISATDIREANAHVNDSTGDPHPQYLTPAEGAVLYAPDAHGHNYADSTHSHTYDSITLKPAQGLLGVSSGNLNFNTAGDGASRLVPNGSVTFTVPPSGKVLLKHTGVMTGSGGDGTTVFSTTGYGTGSTASSSFVTQRHRGSDAYTVNNTFLVAGLTPGASVTLNSFLQSANADTRWQGLVEVWAAP